MPKVLRIKRGYRFKNFPEIVSCKPVTIKPPEQIILRISSEMSLLAGAGDTVRAGQAVAGAGDGCPITVRASLSGTLTEIRDNEKEQYREIIIKAEEEKGDILPLEGEINSAESLCSAGCIRAAHFTGNDGKNAIKHILIRGFYTAPLGVVAGTFLTGMKEEFIEGLKLLRKIFYEARYFLCLLEDDDLAVEMNGIEGLEVVCFDRKCPSDNEVILEESVLGTRVEGHTSTATTMVLSIQDVVQAGYVALTGLPVLDRVVVLCGDGCEQPAALKVPLGTPVRALIEERIAESELSFILGSPLSGRLITDLDEPVGCDWEFIGILDNGAERKFLAFLDPGLRMDSYTRTFLSRFTGTRKSLDTGVHGERRSCVACSFCEEVCPRGLIPHILSKMFRAERALDAEGLHIMDCIRCGLCSYVCPTKIEVMQDIILGQEEILKEREIDAEDSS